MARARTLVLNTKVQVSGQDQLKTLGQRFTDFGNKVKTGALNPTNLLAGAIGGLAAAKTIEFFSDAVNAAAEFQDTVSATGVIIGQDLQAPMEEWAETAAESFGASKQTALQAANQMAVFGKAAGLSGDELVDFSTQLTQLGGDLASFFGGTTEDAITAVGAALRGEFEPIRRYGVLLDDATLRQKAFELGLIKTTKNALTPQQKTLAAQAAILEQTADAQGDFVRTSDGMANTQRRLQAEFENLTIEIGEKLLPVALTLARFVSDDLIPAFEFLADNVIGPVIDGFGNLGQAFREAAGDIHFFAMNFGEQGDIVHKLADDFGTSFDEMKDRVRDIMVETGATFEEAVEEIQDQAREGGIAAANEYARGLADERPRGALVDAVDQLSSTQIAAMEDHWDEIRQLGTDMVTEYNVGIFEAQNSLQTEIDAMLKALDERLTPGEEIAKLRGEKMQLALARGIKLDQGDLGAVAAIDALIAKINLQLNGLNGYDKGTAFTRSFAAGLVDPVVIDFVKQSAYRVALAARGIFPSSEPKDPNSPFRGITKAWGFGEVLARGILTGKNAVSAAVMGLTSGVSMPAIAVGAGAVPASGGGGTVINNWYLRWDGEPPKGRNEAEIIAVLNRLTGLVDTMTVPS